MGTGAFLFFVPVFWVTSKTQCLLRIIVCIYYCEFISGQFFLSKMSLKRYYI